MLSETFWKVILILRTSMIWCIPWPPGAWEERIRIPPTIFVHICEGEEGKHYEPYEISTSSFVKDKRSTWVVASFKKHYFAGLAPTKNGVKN